MRPLRESILIYRYGSNTDKIVKDPLQQKHRSLRLTIDINHLVAHLNVDRLLFHANSGRAPFDKWLSRIARYGVSEALAKELSGHLKEIQFRMTLRFESDRQRLAFRFGMTRYDDLVEVIPMSYAALMVASLVESGALDGLKRCGMSDCKNLFVGSDRAKWCSETCGSRHRVRNKRKRDKEAGNLESRYL